MLFAVPAGRSAGVSCRRPNAGLDAVIIIVDDRRGQQQHIHGGPHHATLGVSDGGDFGSFGHGPDAGQDFADVHDQWSD